MTLPESDTKAMHEFLDHTSELELHVRAPTFAELAGEAGRALVELMKPGCDETGVGEWRSIAAEGVDRAALLVAWLNELVYLAEVERWVPTEIQAELTGDNVLEIRARGVHLKEAPSLVKAATYHGLQVRDTDAGVEAEVIFDV